jgi:hypothetical protein
VRQPKTSLLSDPGAARRPPPSLPLSMQLGSALRASHGCLGVVSVSAVWPFRETQYLGIRAKLHATREPRSRRRTRLGRHRHGRARSSGASGIDRLLHWREAVGSGKKRESVPVGWFRGSPLWPPILCQAALALQRLRSFGRLWLLPLTATPTGVAALSLDPYSQQQV